MLGFVLTSLVVIGFSVVTDLSLQKWGAEWAEKDRVLRALRIGLLAFMFNTMLSCYWEIRCLREGLGVGQERNELELAVAAIQDMNSNSLFRREVEPRLEDLRKYLASLRRGLLELSSAQEVTDVWARQIQTSSSSIKATNIISPEFWDKSEMMGSRSLEAHKSALARGVKVYRLWIVDEVAARQVESLRRVAAAHADLGVATRYVSLRRMEASPGYGACYKALSTQDLVVFDESVVLLTYWSESRQIIGGTLSERRTEQVNPAMACFAKWWDIGTDSLEGIHSVPATRGSAAPTDAPAL